MGLRLRCGLQRQGCVVQSSRTVRAIAAPTHTFPIIAARRGGTVTLREGEEPGTTPGGAGDGAGDGREAGIGRAPPVKSIGCDGDGVALAVIVANEHRAGFELARAAYPPRCSSNATGLHGRHSAPRELGWSRPRKLSFRDPSLQPTRGSPTPQLKPEY